MLDPRVQTGMLILIAVFFVLMVAMTTIFILNRRKVSREEALQEPTPTPAMPPPQPQTTAPAPVPAPAEAPAPIPAAKPTAQTAPQSPAPPTPEDDFQSSKSLTEALKNTEKSFFGRIRSLFQNETATKNFEDLEEILYTSDLGPQTVTRLMAKLDSLKSAQKSDLQSLKTTLKDEFLEIFNTAQNPEPIQEKTLAHLQTQATPTVWMIVGVNGAGKTTSIGKLSAHLAKSNKKVLVAAGDTFRAAAGSQLKVWTDRAQVELFSPEGVTDPSAVAFDAVAKARAQNFDMVLLDTAGRLHTQANLMEELKKVKRVLAKVIPEAPHETLIVLDANSGQNALQQAREFHQALGLTGVILTKMDGTAKGGVAVGLSQELKIPIRLIGIGEKIGDLKAFSAKEFVDSILGGA